MTTFILIHGAWHGAWCWERVTPLLEKQGCRVLAPDLPGMGKDVTPLAMLSLDYWARFVSDLASKQDEKVILVGHSRGGIVISQAAEYAAKYIQGLIYLAAFLIPNGESLWSTMQQSPRAPDHPPDLILSADKTTSTVTEAAAYNTFYNTTAEKWQKHALSQLGLEPMMSFTTPLHLTEGEFGRIPRAYIECLQDKALPIALQRSMVAALPCNQVITLDTDHSPFYSAPELLAAELIALARRFDAIIQ